MNLKVLQKMSCYGAAMMVGLGLLAACATSSGPTSKPSGFLPDYNLLQPVAIAPSGIQAYTYSSPSFNLKNYHAIIVDPVILYQSATTQGVTEDQIEAARANIQQGVVAIVSKKIAITNQAGPGVARLSVAITGAEVTQDGFKAYNLIPISAAIKLASMATDLNGKKAVLVVELKFVDSTTGALLRETLTAINGDNFRDRANTAQEFEALAGVWVTDALQYSANQRN